MSKVIFDSWCQDEQDGPFNPANVCGTLGQVLFALDQKRSVVI